MINYFKIIDESNYQILSLIDKTTIQKNQWFPIYGFSKINGDIHSTKTLKAHQDEKIGDFIENINNGCKNTYTSIKDIEDCEEIANSNKITAIVWAILNKHINLEQIEDYLKNYYDKETTSYRKLLCAYDYVKYRE